jgi:hypothetical protein
MAEQGQWSEKILRKAPSKNTVFCISFVLFSFLFLLQDTFCVFDSGKANVWLSELYVRVGVRP